MYIDWFRIYIWKTVAAGELVSDRRFFEIQIWIKYVIESRNIFCNRYVSRQILRPFIYRKLKMKWKTCRFIWFDFTRLDDWTPRRSNKSNLENACYLGGEHVCEIVLRVFRYLKCFKRKISRLSFKTAYKFLKHFRDHVHL